MSRIHFLNVLEGDCNIIEHDSGRISVIDVSNASNEIETPAERAVRTSAERQQMLMRTQVPINKIDYRQKLQPDNPIHYFQSNLKKQEIFRFIITHPDMDHLDGIKDLFESMQINCFWDTNNNKEIVDFRGGGYNKEDWDFYLKLRNGNYRSDVRREFYAGNSWNYFQEDYLHILAPTQTLVQEANRSGNYNDCSYVLLYTPPKADGSYWKILFSGDSHDKTWEYILQHNRSAVSNIDILFAPHHGRDSNRSYDFLQVVRPKITLFGNASSNHLAYNKYPEIRITNNQAGYIVLLIDNFRITVYVKHKLFADSFRNNPKRNWGAAPYNDQLLAYELGYIDY